MLNFFSTTPNMEAEIIIKLVPDDSLTASDLRRLVERAEAAGQTPEQFIATAIKNRLDEKGEAA